MNKRQAEAIGRDIERHGCTVTGYRRWVSPNERVAIWSVDAKDNDTGIPFTVDRAEQWDERKRAARMEAVAATPGRPPLSPDGVRMTYHSIAMPDALWAWAERGDTRSANVRKAVDAVRLLSDEQWAWLTRRDDAPAALEDAVRQAMLVERAEAEADATVDWYKVYSIVTANEGITHIAHADPMANGEADAAFIAAARAAVPALLADVDALTQERDAYARNLADAQSDIAAEIAERNTLANDRAEHIARLAQERDEWRQQCDALQDNLMRLTAERNALSAQVAKLEAYKQRIQDDAVAAAQQLAAHTPTPGTR